MLEATFEPAVHAWSVDGASVKLAVDNADELVSVVPALLDERVKGFLGVPTADIYGAPLLIDLTN